MGALALPQAYSIQDGKAANAIARRIGIKFNDEIRPLDVVGYDVSEGWIRTTKGEILHGKVEPFWRTTAPSDAIASKEKSSKLKRLLEK